jgi:hypothetical protein
MRRRGGRRQRSGSTPDTVGTALREAREDMAVTLGEVHDRTGVPLQQLEALEAGDLSRFPDLRSALTAVRRCSDLTKLDTEGFARVVQDHWSSALDGSAALGARGVAANGGWPQSASGTDAVPTGHLSRYPGDGTHLRAFTQTAEVPGVRRAGAGNGHAHVHFNDTGSFPATPASPAFVRPAPVVLRGAVWLTATVLVVALGGLAVAHWKPQLLKDIHLVRTTNTTIPPAPGAIGRPGGRPASHPRSTVVTQTVSSTGSATISVRATNYSVVVAAWARCWTVVSSPQSFSPVFQGILQGGQVKVFNSNNGQLTVNLGASLVTMEVRINGKTVPGWVFKPKSAPFVLNFTSNTSG